MILCQKRRRIHVSEEEEDTCVRRGGGYMCQKRRRIHVSEEDSDEKWSQPRVRGAEEFVH
jgi:hypothetical protein